MNKIRVETYQIKLNSMVIKILNENEKHTLIFLLQKLEVYHHDVYLNRSGSELDALMRLG